MLRAVTLANFAPAIMKPRDMKYLANEYPFLEFEFDLDIWDTEDIEPMLEVIKDAPGKPSLALSSLQSMAFLNGDPSPDPDYFNTSQFRRIYVQTDSDIDVPAMKDMIAMRFAGEDHCFSFGVYDGASSAAVWQICEQIPDAYPLFDLREAPSPIEWPWADFPKVGDALRAHGYYAHFDADTIKVDAPAIAARTRGGPFWLKIDMADFLVANGDKLQYKWRELKQLVEQLSPFHRKGGCRESPNPVRAQIVNLENW